jgi:hypothetical protein
MKTKQVFLLAYFTVVSVLTDAQSIGKPAVLKTKQTYTTDNGAVAKGNGFTCEKIKISVDTSIKVAPKYAYLSIEFINLSGGSQMDILNGSNNFWVTDSKGIIMPIKEKFLKKVNSAMGTNVVNMLCKIPFKLKTENKPYTITYQWESKDKLKNIEVITTSK